MGKWNLPELDRWAPLKSHSWPYRVFKKYDSELHHIVASYVVASKYTYSHLKIDGALFTDKACVHFPQIPNTNLSLKNWSDDFNLFKNWIYLNSLMAISAYFETYLASIVKECIESDPGLLLGCSHSVDGIKLLKYGHSIHKESIDSVIIDCTKGDWCSRISHMKALFGEVPDILEKNISQLERIRKMRNEIAHAFGRDIEHTRDYTNITLSPMHSIKYTKFHEYSKLIGNIVQQIDIQLVSNNIGNFEPLYHYHNLYSSLKNKDKEQKLMKLKKYIGQNDVTYYSKDDCRMLIIYYENL